MKAITIGLLGATLATPSVSEGWFEQNTPLTQAHQHLLEDNLQGMFNSLVELWQTNESQDMSQHLDELLEHSLTKDCGKSLSDNKLSEWLKTVKISRQTIQSPGRNTFRLVVTANSVEELASIKMSSWSEKPLSVDSSFLASSDGVTTYDNEKQYSKRYNLSGKLDTGLYRIEIITKNNQSWSSWIILGQPEAPHYVRWTSNQSWKVDKRKLLNPFCPLPQMDIELYDYLDDRYVRIWGERYKPEYPKQLNINKLTDVPNDRYVLAVRMHNQRWQGEVIIEQSQSISQTYDISQ